MSYVDQNLQDRIINAYNETSIEADRLLSAMVELQLASALEITDPVERKGALNNLLKYCRTK